MIAAARRAAPEAGPSGPGPALEPASELRAIFVFASASQAALQQLVAAMEEKALRKRAALVVDKAWSGKAAFVLSGACRAMAVAPNGESLCLKRAEAGEALELASALCGVQTLTGLRLIADETARLVFLPGAALASAAALCPALNAALVSTLAKDQIETAWRLFESRTLDLRARLEGELLRLGARGVLHRGAVLIEKPPTQRELADLIGAAREGVARHLSAFEAEGLIERRPGRLALLDVRRMVEDFYNQTGRVIDAYAPGGRLAGPWLAQGPILKEGRGNAGQ